MSSGGMETSVGGEAALGGGDKKRDSLGTAGSPAHLIIKGMEWWGYRPGGFQRSSPSQARPLTPDRAPDLPSSPCFAFGEGEGTGIRGRCRSISLR